MRHVSITGTMAIAALAATMMALLMAGPASARPELGDGLVRSQLESTPVSPTPDPGGTALATSDDDGLMSSTSTWLALVAALGVGAAAIAAARTTLRRRHRVAV